VRPQMKSGNCVRLRLNGDAWNIRSILELGKVGHSRVVTVESPSANVLRANKKSLP
jgi:hypothetical protein